MSCTCILSVAYPGFFRRVRCFLRGLEQALKSWEQDGVLRWVASPSPPATEARERHKLPQRGSGRKSDRLKRFSRILHCESKKLDPFSFEHNFRKYCPVVIILLLFRQKLSTHKHIIEFPTSPIVCCSTALKNATAYTSSQKLLNKSAMHAVISLLLQSRKFWCYLLLTTLKRRHNNVILLSAIRMCLVTTVFQQDSPPAHCTARMQQLNCCVKKRRTFLRPTCSLQTVQISVLWITRSGLSCSIVSTTDKSIVWMNWNSGSSMSGAVLNSHVLTRLLTSGEKDIKCVSVLK